MLTAAIICLILAALAFFYAKLQPRGREEFVSVKMEELPDGSTRELIERSSSESFSQMDMRLEAVRNHRIAMLVAVVSALAGIGLGIAAHFHA